MTPKNLKESISILKTALKHAGTENNRREIKKVIKKWKRELRAVLKLRDDL